MIIPMVTLNQTSCSQAYYFAFKANISQGLPVTSKSTESIPFLLSLEVGLCVVVSDCILVLVPMKGTFWTNG